MAAISVSELHKSYGAIKAVDGLSFFVDSGKIFSMLGPNGAGKTTTIEILEGLRPRDSGDVQVLGVDPWKDGYALH
ncbi:MAG: ATP-binding cassette domain-containing protein, partial [Nitrososphaerales archaeon]